MAAVVTADTGRHLAVVGTPSQGAPGHADTIEDDERSILLRVIEVMDWAIRQLPASSGWRHALRVSRGWLASSVEAPPAVSPRQKRRRVPRQG